MKWEDTGRGYTEFLAFLFEGDLEKFYEGQRWKVWRDEVPKVPGDRAWTIYPFLWSKEGGTIDERSRKAVPIEELWQVHAVSLAKQLAGVPDGTPVQIIIQK